MTDVGRNDHPPASNCVADKLRRDILTQCDIAHLFRADPPPGIVHLREVAVRILEFAAYDPVGARTGSDTATVSIVASVMSVGRRHDLSVLRVTVVCLL